MVLFIKFHFLIKNAKNSENAIDIQNEDQYKFEEDWLIKGETIIIVNLFIK